MMVGRLWEEVGVGFEVNKGREMEFWLSSFIRIFKERDG